LLVRIILISFGPKVYCSCYNQKSYLLIFLPQVTAGGRLVRGEWWWWWGRREFKRGLSSSWEVLSDVAREAIGW